MFSTAWKIPDHRERGGLGQTSRNSQCHHTHEYPEDTKIRIDNIHLALSGFLQLKVIIANIERALLPH